MRAGSETDQLSLEGVLEPDRVLPGLPDKPLVFVDIETTGLSAASNRIIEVAAIRVEHGRITRIVDQLINPGVELPAYISDITGIRPQDLRGAMPFRQLAAELADVLRGAVFVAHNVRFDYSFLKAEFKRLDLPFLPRQLCTMKLSKTLYPTERSHKLESLITRHNLSYEKRHRAYDDAHALWQFIQHVCASHDPLLISQAVAKQLKQPALPQGIKPELVKSLPAAPGVYIFEDDNGKPLYIGKSINIKKRVLQHFGHDHDESKEFKIAQSIAHINTLQTGGELEALLLESRLVKEMMPLYNRKLRKTDKLLLARRFSDPDGYDRVIMEEAANLQPDCLSDILAVYDRRSHAKRSLEAMVRDSGLCPKLLGLEKSSRSCFLYQLRRCRGACAGAETADSYNRRLALAFERQRIRNWPYSGAVLMKERFSDELTSTGIIVDQWCVIGQLGTDDAVRPQRKHFDLDTYKILQGFLTTKLNRLVIEPLSRGQLQQFGI